MHFRILFYRVSIHSCQNFVINNVDFQVTKKLLFVYLMVLHVLIICHSLLQRQFISLDHQLWRCSLPLLNDHEPLRSKPHHSSTVPGRSFRPHGALSLISSSGPTLSDVSVHCNCFLHIHCHLS